MELFQKRESESNTGSWRLGENPVWVQMVERNQPSLQTQILDEQIKVLIYGGQGRRRPR
jgi:hypothetical protein